MLYVEEPNVQISLRNCEFTDNVAPQEWCVVRVLRGADLAFDDCQFRGNRALSSLVFVQRSNLVLQYCNASDIIDLLYLEDAT